ncbi:MAG: TSUP family transporter [Clostridia bacterium]|nr:TSUP family transporter [Clostridia bacterium]MCI1999260.1 TSUP family transporter [Clostridia bacterium]MCI2014787.1 TSUP family transporter [Clostridia bacterium]
MEINAITFLIVCPMVFLAGFVDSIGGGGGLISLPAYFIAGIPMHNAIATNKLSSATGTTVSTLRYLKHAKIDWGITLPAIVLSFIGSSFGARISLRLNENILKGILLVVLPIVAFFVLKKGTFINSGKQRSRKATGIITMTAALVIGCYDGLYGPGTGTFILIALISIAGVDAMKAAGMTKVINLTSNVSALSAFLLHGQVFIILGLTASVFSIAGHYVGSGMVLKNGTKVIKPIVLIVLVVLIVKVILSFK